MGRNASTHSESPVRGRSSPRRRSPPRREKSPPRHRSSHKAISPPRDKPANQTRSPRRGKSRSPSPRTKRLKRAEVERGTEKVSVSRENERHNSRGDDRATHRERGSEKEVPSEKRERRSGRDAADGGSSRSRHGRSTSPSDRHRSSRHRSRSPRVASDKSEATNSRGAEHRNGDNDSVAIMKATEEALETKEKQKPSFELSGKLAAETNRVKGVTLLFNEPPEARKPDIRWRLYVFKGGEVLNGSQVEKEQPDGTSSKKVWPYLMDLGSTNGTFVNENRIEPQRYYELFERDTIKFGNSSPLQRGLVTIQWILFDRDRGTLDIMLTYEVGLGLGFGIPLVMASSSSCQLLTIPRLFEEAQYCFLRIIYCVSRANRGFRLYQTVSVF
ncbi:hypothetical protein C3L33_11603, partial [Rhododendron williamsianum]